jgi:hypothetical protein
MLLIYATTSDLAAWLDPTEPPDNAASLLRSASIFVARAVNESLYSDSTIINGPKRDATLTQVTAWVTAGIDPATGGLQSTPIVRQKSVDSASLTYDTSLAASVTAFQARQAIANELCPEATGILYSAGLLYAPLPVWSGAPDAGIYVDELGRPSRYYWRAPSPWLA